MTGAGSVGVAAFAIEADLELPAGSDPGAVGAAITTELCGTWQHAGTCRWPHNTRVVRLDGPTLRTRTVVVAPKVDRQVIVRRAQRALRTARIEPPGTDAPAWRLIGAKAGPLHADEQALARRLGNMTPT